MRGTVFAAITAIVCAAGVKAQPQVVLDPTEILAGLKSGSTVMSIPIENRLDRSIHANLTLEWLGTDDRVLGSGKADISTAPGKLTVEVPMRLPVSSIWLRLRYALTPDRSDPGAFEPRQGIVALSQIAGHVFEVKLGHSIGPARSGALFTVHAQAVHPRTRAPVEGVQWNATLLLDDKELRPSRIVPGEAGFADLVFDIPAGLIRNGGTPPQVNVLGDFVREESTMLYFGERSSAQIQTDKPIYQPGQTMHVRALIFDAENKAAAGEEVTMEILDPDGNRVHTAELTASRFGVVQEDWTLPASSGLGAYQFLLKIDQAQIGGRHSVRVSRYELPAFNVSAKPDKSAYLPGQSAAVEIRGDYLFGKPVPKGSVKITRLGAPRWNSKTHSYETIDETVAEGQSDEGGVYIAHLDLKADFDDLGDGRFEDLHYAAYFTDASSGRTEQKKFDIRISAQPIHVYLRGSYATGSLPVPVYISTFYADGRPAETTVDVGLKTATQRETVRTNRFGVARAYLAMGDRSAQELAYREIEAQAKDSAGVSGTASGTVLSPRDLRMRLDTARTLYRAGEAVTVRVSSLDMTGSVMLDAEAEAQSVGSRIVRLANGQAEVTFPYQPEFRGDVVFIAWNGEAPRNVLASKAVIFPDTEDLHVTIAPGKASYRPGEKAALRMTVSTAGGQPVESALGVAVVDQAVTDRARTDEEFGRGPWFSCARCTRSYEAIGEVHRNDLYHLNSAMPAPADLDLVAEMLTAGDTPFLQVNESENLRTGQKSAFADTFRTQMLSLRQALDQRYVQTLDYPRDETTLSSWLGRTWWGMLDPWGRPYSARFSTDGGQDVLEIVSSGPDELPGTDDDFSIGEIRRDYFLPTISMIRRLLDAQEDYPASDADFRALLSSNGLNLDKLADRWGTPYRVRVSTFMQSRRIWIDSAGPDRAFDTPDDFVIAAFNGRYFERETEAISAALRAAPSPPRTNDEFRAAMLRSGIDISAYRDAWGKPYTFDSAIHSRYDDRRTRITARDFGGQASTRTEITPVTQEILTFSLRSAGPDGMEDSPDDFVMAAFPVLLREESATSDVANAASGQARGAGSITGTVIDPAGAAVAGATVRCFGTANTTPFETTTDSKGEFTFNSLAAGSYTLRAESRGFTPYEIHGVPVVEGKATAVDVSLDVGVATESVTVTAAALTLQTESGELARSVSLPLLAIGVNTPRVRDYFPETLLWAPELLTDPQGRASLQFDLAGNVTTWKVAVIASTLDGRIAQTETDLRAFQPFFLEFNPPPVLTAGDSMDLPVTVFNYLDRAQKVSLNWQANSWSKLHGAAAQTLMVARNASANAAYSIQALSPADAAKQRVSAAAGSTRDGIERSLRVHPDGQEITQTFEDLAAGRIGFDVAVPRTAIAGATRAEIRLYPNILAVLLESARGILEQPHGCAEQTISAGYANLIALRYARAIGMHDGKIETRALTNVLMSRDQLEGFRASDGGVSYWRDGKPDIAVTAHALNFLADASSIAKVDRDQMDTFVRFLGKAQKPDGRWEASDSRDEAQNRLLSGLVARSLAAAQREGVDVPPAILAGAYRHLAALTGEFEEPYMLAQFALAAMDSGGDSLAKDIVARLLRLAREENGAVYWDLRTNTPFYGWGSAGRLETSGLAVSALAEWRARHPEETGFDQTIRRGLVFLLRRQDHFGGWQSTQATVRAMQAIADAAGSLGNFAGAGGGAEVRVNGRLVKSLPFPDDPRAGDPILLDVSAFLAPGENHIEMIPSSTSGAAVVRVVETHWTPWTESHPRNSAELRFSATFDRTDAGVGERIRCSVGAERVGFRGYGMMLAEIGLPPGADVDRGSLEALLADPALGVERYDILPDRIVFYLWPQAGGASFEFGFRTRMTMKAKSAGSWLYDYYSPEELAEAQPETFTIR